MKARPNINDYGIGNGYIDLSMYAKDVDKWADEAEQEIKELRQLLERVKIVGFSIEISKQISEVLKKE